MPKQDVTLPFPLRGVNKSLSHLAGDPDTTVYASNVFPKDVTESRIRGGSRKGLVKRFPTQVDGDPQYLLEVSKVTADFNEPYQYLMVGTSAGIYVSSATRSIVNGVVTYTETLNEINANITDHLGADITDHLSDPISTASFVLTGTGNAYSGNVAVYQGSVIFAQPREVIQATTAGATVSSGILQDTAGTNFQQIGIDPTTHVVNILTTAAGASVGSYKISSITSGSIVLVDTTVGTGGAITYEVVTAPKILDVENRTSEIINPTGGTFPSGDNAIIATYRDRLVWAVGTVWYMSRVGDSGDYNFSADLEDAGRPVAGTASDAGLPGDPITAMVAVGYDFLLMFAEQSTWVLRGDPAFGGQLFNLSRTVGCVSPESWCYGPNGEVYFLSKDGLYIIAPNMSQPPVPVSDGKMPTELKERDNENFDTAIAYDMKDNAVIIFVTPRDGLTVGSHWWYDTTTDSFWEFSFSDYNKQPVAALSYAGAPTRQRGTLTLGLDGYIRELSGTTDDGDVISSKIVIGPFVMSQSLNVSSMLSELHTELGTGSGSVTVDVYVGDNAEQLLQSAVDGDTPDFTRDIGAGRSKTIRTRLRGPCSVFVLHSNEAWSAEALVATVSPVGRVR